MAYKEFINDFNKDITRNALFLYGAEDFLMDWAIDQIVSKYVDESARNLDVQFIDGDTCQAADIMGAARAFSMFSEKRVIIIRNYLPLHAKTTDVDGDALLEFCANNEGEGVLVFVLESKLSKDGLNAYAKKMLKSCSSYEFAKLDKAELQGFINKRVHQAGKMLGHREMDYLIDLTGYYNKNSEYTLAKLDKDIEKITNACQGDQIENSLIEELLVGDEDKYVFNLVEALMSGNKGKTMELAERIISEDDGSMMVLSLLSKQFEIMYDSLELSRKGMSISEIAKKTGVNEYRLKRAYQSARAFNQDRIKDILIKIYNIDRDIKTGALDRNVAFELLLISI